MKTSDGQFESGKPINEIVLPYDQIKAYDVDTEMSLELHSENKKQNVNNLAFFVLANDKEEFTSVTDYSVSDGVVKFKMPKIEENKYYPQIMDDKGKVYSSANGVYIDVVYNPQSRAMEIFPIIKEQIVEAVIPHIKHYVIENKQQFTGAQGKQGVQGEQGIQGERGERGFQGNRGRPFLYEDFTPQQLMELFRKAQLKPGEYAELIHTLNGLISKGNVKPDDLSPELLELLTNSEGASFEILSIPRDGSVTPVKTSFMKKTRNLFDGTYRNGALAVNSGNMVLNNDVPGASTSNLAVIPISSGVTYTIKVHGSHDVLRIAVNNSEPVYTGNNNILTRDLLNSRSVNEHTFTNTSSGRFLLVQTSETDEKPLLQVEQGEVASDYVDPYQLPQSLVADLDDNIDRYDENFRKLLGDFDITFYQGNLVSNDGVVEYAKNPTPNRIVTEYHYLNKGDMVQSNPGYYVTGAIKGGNRIPAWQSTPFVIDVPGEYSFMVRNEEQGDITPQDGDENIRFVAYDKAITTNDLDGVIETDLRNGFLSIDETVVPVFQILSKNRITQDFIELSAGDRIVPTNGFRISVAERNATRISAWQESPYVVETDGEYVFMISKSDDSNMTLEDATGNVKIYSPNRVARMNDIINVGNTDIVKYVTLNGNDGNSGDTRSSGYSTLQKAINENAKTVYMERGIYNQSANASVDKLTILPINIDNTDPYTEPRKNITFMGADKLEDWTEFEGVYRKSVSRNYPNYTDVFIDQSKPISTTSSRPQYNAILWESSNIVDDYVMEPVLSISEVKSVVGTFYYDGNYIYINPKNIDNNFYAPHRSKGLDFRNTKELTIEDVTAEYFLSEGIDVDKVTKIHAQNCQSNHSSYADGFSADYTNGKFTNCKGYRNRNDAFNLHFYGDTEFINCIGEYNYDDGISHHEHCTGVVIGGSFSFNGKGGSAPVQEAKVSHYNVKFEGNEYGILNSRAGEGNISSGNLFKDNRFGISSNNSGHLTSFNDKFIDNQTDITTNGVVDQY